MAKKTSTTTEEWNNIIPELRHKLVQSCGRRCAQVIQSNDLYSYELKIVQNIKVI